MNAGFFFRGLILGFVIAAPVGPVGILCIYRTLVKGKKYGLISGLGAATADAIYGAIAALGLTFISSFLVEQRLLLRVIGAVFLCGLGIRTFFSKAAKKPGVVDGQGFAYNYGSTFFLTLMNPITILAFAAIFAGLGITNSHNGFASLLILGVFIGSGLWWILLSNVADLFRQKINRDNLIWLNRISGAIITIFGLLLLLNLKT
jgi:threonine/homoserine/homoserine lactone efflux protein